jgi:hypothetical protein
MQKTQPGVDVDRLVVLAKGDCRPLTLQNAERAKVLRKRHRDMAVAGNCADTIPILMELAKLTAKPWVLRSLVRALRLSGEQQAASRLAEALKARPVSNGNSPDQMDVPSDGVVAACGSGSLRERARAESQANAAALQSNRDVLSRLEEMIAARVGTPVRHVRSETALTPQPDPRRSIVHRRGYTRHWFEPRGTMDARLRSRFGGDGQLAVFVKSSLVLRTRPQLEFILNEHTGRGFRAPYFFGQFSVADMHVAAWEAIDIQQVGFSSLSFEDQARVVRAIAGVNALSAAGAAPVLTRWIDRPSKWFEARFSRLPSPASKRWQDLYAGTIAVLEHRSSLAKRVCSAGESFVTHNDVTEDGSNILVPKDGDVVIFDWEGSTLSVPGADLGVLTEAASGERLMAVYVDEMADKGFDLDLDRIRFTAEVVWGFRLLQGAWRRNKPHQAELALSMLRRHTSGS